MYVGHTVIRHTANTAGVVTGRGGAALRLVVPHRDVTVNEDRLDTTALSQSTQCERATVPGCQPQRCCGPPRFLLAIPDAPRPRAANNTNVPIISTRAFYDQPRRYIIHQTFVGRT